MGKASGARVPWESPPIGAGGRKEPAGGRDVTFAREAGSAAGIEKATEVAETVKEVPDHTDHGKTLDDTTLDATGALGPMPNQRVSAAEVVASAQWTGRRSRREQVAIVEAFGPIAYDSVNQLAAALEARRLNDPKTQDALAALKELHAALGALIAEAERVKPSAAVWRRIEDAKEKFTDAIWDGAQVMFVAPALALGTATVLSFLSGFPVSEGMVTALCATGMGKDAILTLAKRK